MTTRTLAKTTRSPYPSLKQAFSRLRLVPTLSASPAPPVAHPFTHDTPPARCPACELRAYLDD